MLAVAQFASVGCDNFPTFQDGHRTNFGVNSTVLATALPGFVDSHLHIFFVGHSDSDSTFKVRDKGP